MKITFSMNPENNDTLLMTLTCDCDESLHDVLKKLKRCAALSENLSAVTFDRMHDQWMFDIDDDDESEEETFTYTITVTELNELLTNTFDLITTLFEELVDVQVKAELDEMKRFVRYKGKYMM